VVSAPAYEPGALDAPTVKPGTRVLVAPEKEPGGPDLRSALGGLLVQERDALIAARADMQVVCGAVAEEAWPDVLFAWTVCKHVTSNGIALARDRRTIGVGAGQMSRVDAVRIALEKARDHGHEITRAVLASDAFFPFADGPQIALDAGVRTIVQPGGSKRDDDVIAAVRSAGAAMVFTGRRHFRH
jgi:phosphoribosylaminoimidazolecarboxamide formyltransferase/IMP cyclohydrolase